MWALVRDLIVRLVLSSNPVPVCILGVHRVGFIFTSVQNSLISLLLKQLPLSVRMIYGVPLSERNFVKNIITVHVPVFLQICAVGHLLIRSLVTKRYTSPRVPELIRLPKSNWISLFGSVKTSSLFLSKFGICVLRFLTVALQLGQLSDFSCISQKITGHQKASDSFSILAAAACPWCSIAMMEVLLASGIIILSL